MTQNYCSLASSLGRHIEADADFAVDDRQLLLLLHRHHAEAEKLLAEVQLSIIDEFVVLQAMLDVFDEGFGRTASITVVEEAVFNEDWSVSVIHRLGSHVAMTDDAPISVRDLLVSACRIH